VVSIRRGEIWWAELGEPRGSEPGHRRPVLVLQDDRFNDSRLATVIAAALTSETRYAEMPGNVLVPAAKSRLDRDSVVNVTQIATIDRSWLVSRVSKLPKPVLAQVDYGLRLTLGL
jgi:mRNA interferase MazF